MSHRPSQLRNRVHGLQRVLVVLPPRGEYYDAEPFVGGGFVGLAVLLKGAHEWTGGYDSAGAFTKEGKVWDPANLE